MSLDNKIPWVAKKCTRGPHRLAVEPHDMGPFWAHPEVVWTDWPCKPTFPDLPEASRGQKCVGRESNPGLAEITDQKAFDASNSGVATANFTTKPPTLMKHATAASFDGRKALPTRLRRSILSPEEMAGAWDF